ncbi:MAG TPA: single-stranded-DNA-specific exonuclease RecJ [Thermoleophilia bacterium]|nr:single-stranded-DNA-specific exonuclease RecJ [Thermoleophilia bacterium]
MTDPGLWRISPAPYADVRRLSTELGVSEVLAQVLVRRGLADSAAARAFLHPEFRVHDPYLMAGMAEARDRIDHALRHSEPIAVHGDYDADGVTATFLLVSILEDLGADVRWRLPNRFNEGYGVSVAAIEELGEAGVKLLVTVDCGINAREEVARAQALGMDVIVTDHHELEGDLPGCPVVSPKLGGYPCAHLAGVGVAFKLAHALLEERCDELVDLPLALRPYADLVAVGTIADVVPLVEENRVLTAIGLGRLRSAPRPGLAALLEVAGGKGPVDAGAVGFRLGPRLNAAGRLEDAAIALELLGAPDRESALPLALRLNELNRERQAIEAAMLDAAVAMVPDPPPPALVLSSPDWHEGVVGIVASRVAERFNRPAVLLSEGEEVAKGSGRSIPAFDLLGAVQRSSEHLLAFGGHRAACGLRLRRDAVAAFRDAFTAEAAAALGPDDLQRVRHVDAVVGGDELTLGLADELELLAPHGFGNRQVTLLLHGAEVVAPRLTRDRRHAHYRVRCEAASCQAIHFNFDDLGELQEPGRHDVALALCKNEYNGAVSAQVQVRSLHRLDSPQEDLCVTGCDASCRERLRAELLWRELLGGDGAASGASGDGEASGADAAAAAALHAARAEGRLVDHRGRPPVSKLEGLLAGGERTLLLVADVARRRPLLSRDVLTPGLGVAGAYVQPACAHRAGGLGGAGVVMTTPEVALADPAFAAGFSHLALLDPPYTTALWAGLAAAAPEAWLHALWGPAEAGFAGRVRESQLDLDATMRRVWKALSAAQGRFDDGLEQELLGRGAALAPIPALAAAFAALQEAGLLVAGGDGGYHLERPEQKVDVARTDAHRRWHNRYQTPDFLRTCLTAQL